jgi:hypothetical protein
MLPCDHGWQIEYPYEDVEQFVLNPPIGLSAKYFHLTDLINARQTSPFRAGSRARTAKLSFSAAFAAALCIGE